ncbi:MAG: hypothetical protein NTW29_02730 [Bacteroidetes bacterium]|nr:hypothetical protein [Bacteroidota bacterium]
MKTATISELKQELAATPPAKVQELCLRLARFKKENKELLTYLLFESHDTTAYIESVKQEMASLFEEVNTTNVYFAKKTLRKILRIINKYIRYCGLPGAEVELLIDYCRSMQATKLPIDRYPVVQNLYNNQVKRIHKALALLHEDLQYDYRSAIQEL